jgi:nitrogen permease regulator 2-like protein
MNAYDMLPLVYPNCFVLISGGSTKQPSFASLFELYCSLRQGKTLREWVTENKNALAGLDVRRFISFGVIKGFLYRVHRYPILVETTNGEKKVGEKRRTLVKYSLLLDVVDNTRRLDGGKHVDALCTLLECSVRDMEEQLADIGNVKWIWR